MIKNDRQKERKKERKKEKEKERSKNVLIQGSKKGVLKWTTVDLRNHAMAI